MSRIAIVVCVFGFLAQMAEAQSPKEAVGKEPQPAGFAATVSELVASMQGTWEIKSATLMGADLPLDQFESLTVDENGLSLSVQKRKVRFAFAEFNINSKTFVAKCSAPEFEGGLAYEIRFTNGVVKIRYRTNGTHVAPEPNVDDRQLLVQTWKKS